MSTHCRRVAIVPVLAALLLAGAARARAQEAQAAPEVGFTSVPFQFFPPGARSLGMGATFIAVADDATASTSNPAGLVILEKPELSLHGRFTSLQPMTTSGAEQIDRPASNTVAISFASGVLPLGPVHLAAYYQQVSNFEVRNDTSGTFHFANQGDSVRIDSATAVDLKLDEFGLSAAVSLGPRLAVGASVAGRRMVLDYGNSNEFLVSQGIHFEDGATARATDWTVAWNAGILVNPNGKVSLGVVYKDGGRFDVPYTVDYEGSAFGPVTCPGPGCTAAVVPIPDVLGGGIALRPDSRWLLSVDASWLRYSQLSDTELRRIPFDIYPPVSNALPPSDFDDVVQWNAGVERVVRAEPAILVRAGFSHRPNFNQAGTVDTGATFGTAGAGFVIGSAVQVDVAASVSGELWEVLSSLVYRF